MLICEWPNTTEVFPYVCFPSVHSHQFHGFYWEKETFLYMASKGTLFVFIASHTYRSSIIFCSLHVAFHPTPHDYIYLVRHLQCQNAAWSNKVINCSRMGHVVFVLETWEVSGVFDTDVGLKKWCVAITLTSVWMSLDLGGALPRCWKSVLTSNWEMCEDFFLKGSSKKQCRLSYHHHLTTKIQPKI